MEVRRSGSSGAIYHATGVTTRAGGFAHTGELRAKDVFVATDDWGIA
jgi:hypothetical protein